MGVMASKITSLTIVYSTVYSGADQRKHQSFASLAFVWALHRRPVNSPHKGPVTRKKCFHLMTSLWCSEEAQNYVNKCFVSWNRYSFTAIPMFALPQSIHTKTEQSHMCFLSFCCDNDAARRNKSLFLIIFVTKHVSHCEKWGTAEYLRPLFICR